MNFFKYYSSNPNATLDEAMAPLKHHSLRYVSADQFNDPYDSKCFFEALDGVREDVFSNTINRHLRIACMSRNPSSPIMWSHYSSQHAGFVIEYNLPEAAHKKVNYENIKPFCFSAKKIQQSILSKTPDITELEIADKIKALLLTDDSYMDNLGKAIFTKHTDWKYEEEYRFIDFNKEGTTDKYIDINIDTQNINSIILGYRFDHAKYDAELRRIIDINYNGVLTVYKAEPSLDEYLMKIKLYEI
ncbi:DUF2971 domain-containing protein [Pseudomonas fragi]|uniref:DUF2971 domain-containing protein n=1 Tax=Pseudomonas fragi TaxID=296 RepID=UPI002D76EA19|nr:DUF2971 domain-containing protein [Pseudomonas fragi]WRT62659.1 DUF2971 domain-containing protein [Pseudomonas fragi]